MPEPDHLLQQRPRRRWRWRILLVLLLALFGAVAGAIYWALSTNQTGNAISYLFAQRLPGRLEIEHTEFNGLNGMVLSGVRLLEREGAVPAVTVDRIVVTGELWRGNIDLIRVEGCQLHATIESVHFLHRLIQAENAIPAGPNPSLIKLHFTGGVKVNGETAIEGAQVAVAATGPMAEVSGKATYAGVPVEVQVSTVGSGDQRKYHITLHQGRLPIWRSCDWLADLKLLPRLPQDARAWVPEHADLKTTVVIADKKWEHFTGEAKAHWDTGRGQGELQIDRRFIKITRMAIRDDGLGELDGQTLIDTDARTVAVSASTWAPGPRLPIPSVVPTASILKAMPRAQFDGVLNNGSWGLKLVIAGTGQTTLTWSAGEPLRIAANNVALSLLQPFLPAELTLASGSASNLTAEVGGNGLLVATATVEQARALWQGWALGSLDGRVALRPVADGVDLDLTFSALGKAAWRAGPDGGRIKLELDSCEGLMVRLKGPQVLPELSGAIVLEAQTRWRDDLMLMDVAKLRLDGVGITDVLRNLDSELDGTVKLSPKRLDAHLLGRITSGDLRMPGGWRDLAKRRPTFNAELSIGNGLILAEKILVRATDANGQAQIDGYSAGLRGRFSLPEVKGTIIGVVDHADLGWIQTLVPTAASVISGEGAVTFTAQVVRDGIESVEGHFLPLDAQLHLGTVLSATGIKGAVKFRIARP